MPGFQPWVHWVTSSKVLSLSLSPRGAFAADTLSGKKGRPGPAVLGTKSCAEPSQLKKRRFPSNVRKQGIFNIYYFPRMKEREERKGKRRRKGGRRTTVLNVFTLQKSFGPASKMSKTLLQKKRLSCEILSVPPFKCHVLPSFLCWRARTIEKYIHFRESNTYIQEPTLPRIAQQFPKCGPGAMVLGILSGYLEAPTLSS